MGIIDKLHPLERKLLPFLEDNVTYKDLLLKSEMQDIQVMRALQWLSNKEILILHESKKDIIDLDTNGTKYSEHGLPEVNFLKAMPGSGVISGEEIKKKAGLDSQEFGVSIGILKKKVAIATQQDKGILKISITNQGLKLREKESLEEAFLKKQFPLQLSSFSDEEKYAYESLKSRRQIVKLEQKKTISITITPAGKELLSDKENFNIEYVEDNISHSMLKAGSWKGKKFRHYDIKINVPSISGAKRHFVKQSMDYIKKVWLELGFKEMEGTMIQSAFWDLDSLFVPQDHPARAMQDSFYIKDPAEAKIPADIKKRVKAVHETGANTGSRGWGGKWSEKEAAQNMLRTHTTVLSARTIASLKKEQLPVKFFSVNKVYRNEALNWKHLFELHQVEGIVVDPNATLKHLKGYLKEFYNKLGFEKVRMRPAHFPYTEPSLEIDVFHPEKKQWVELGGAGIFRPEVVKTLLGIDIPVLAWGQGLERGIMSYYEFKDIRHLYNNDIKEIKEVKIWK